MSLLWGAGRAAAGPTRRRGLRRRLSQAKDPMDHRSVH